MWPSVRKGEEENIFPYQEDADVMFNSALIYELAVLKLYAEPILFGIEKDCEEYVEAKRLLKFLDYLLVWEVKIFQRILFCGNLLVEDVLTYKNIRNIVGRQSIDCLLICIIEKNCHIIWKRRGECQRFFGDWMFE